MFYGMDRLLNCVGSKLFNKVTSNIVNVTGHDFMQEVHVHVVTRLLMPRGKRRIRVYVTCFVCIYMSP